MVNFNHTLRDGIQKYPFVLHKMDWPLNSFKMEGNWRFFYFPYLSEEKRGNGNRDNHFINCYIRNSNKPSTTADP